MIVAPKLLHDVSRIFCLIVYLVFICLAFYQASQIRVYFTNQYFVSESSDIKRFFEVEEKYFKAGGEYTITIVDNADLDYSKVEN